MKTKRARVTAELRAAVSTMAPGSRLASEHALAQQHEVSRETIRAVLRTLVEEGLIRTDQGLAGAIVRNRATIERTANRDSSTVEHVTVNTRVYFERADPATAALLDISPGDEVTIRDCQTYIDDEPTQLATSRLPRSITRDTSIEAENLGPGGLVARLEEIGHVLTHEERVRLHRLTTEEAAKLEMPTNSPALQVIRTTNSEAGQKLEINTMTFVDRYELIYKVER